jgi:hypothetical protein
MSATATFSVWKILGYLLALLAFVVMAGIGIRTIPANPRGGWFATILFATMGVIAVVEIVRICGLDQDQIPEIKAQSGIRQALVHAAALIITIFLGVTDNFISESFTQSFPRPGVWLGTFLTTLAFYPLREQKENFPNFTVWTIACALLGVASVVVSYLKGLGMRFIRLLGAVVVFYGLSYFLHALMQILSVMPKYIFRPLALIFIGTNLTIGVLALVNGIGLLLAKSWSRVAWLVTVTLLVLFHNLILLLTYLAGGNLTQQILNVLLIFLLAVISWAKLGDSSGKKYFS